MSSSTRIVVPTEGHGGLTSPRSAHFGHAPSFTIVEVVDGRTVGVTTLVNPPHTHGGCGATVQLLAGSDVSVALVVGMGRGPLSKMQSVGITPFFDDVSETPEAAVAAYLSGELAPFGDDRACSGH